jgi:hypothetical protein
MTIKGVDTTDRTLTGAILKANGYKFVCRYYQYGGTNPGKELTKAEVVEKSAAGIRIVSNYETDGDPANTIATGERHARNFLAQHKDVGGPDWAPCYFSIDLAVNPSSRDLYMRGLCNVLGVGRVGIYGEDALIVHAKNAGLLTYGWRSMSASFPGNPAITDCQLVQTGGGHVAGHAVDFDTALAPLYGGWLRGEDDPMALTKADAVLVANAVWAKLIANSVTGGTAPAEDFITDIHRTVHSYDNIEPAGMPPNSLANSVRLVQHRTDDYSRNQFPQLAASLAALPAAVVAALPAGSAGGITVAQVEQAVATALGKLQLS